MTTGSHSISTPILIGQINLTEQVLDLSFFLKEKGTVSALLYSVRLNGTLKKVISYTCDFDTFFYDSVCLGGPAVLQLRFKETSVDPDVITAQVPHVLWWLAIIAAFCSNSLICG